MNAHPAKSTHLIISQFTTFDVVRRFLKPRNRPLRFPGIGQQFFVLVLLSATVAMT